MQPTGPIYSVTLQGNKLKLRFTVEESPSKMGVNMQFVFDDVPQDPRDKQELTNKISVALQKKFGDAGIAIDYNDRNPYENVISFIVPLDSVSKMLMSALKS